MTDSKKPLFSEEEKAILKYVPPGQSPKIYIDLIRSQILGVDKQGQPRPYEDFLYFLYVCKRTGLDPMAKQIYAVYRWDTRLGKEKMTIQVSIDGMRVVAQRSGEYAGQDDVIYEPSDEKTPNPEKARVTVYKMVKGARCPITATARWNEYAQKDGKGELIGLWKKMPYLMLGKIAENLALRKSFPNELSGLYAEEEMPSRNVLDDLPSPKEKREEPKKEEAKEEKKPEGQSIDIVAKRKELEENESKT